MSKPIIILGAGASRDYSDRIDIRPPITNELVEGKYLSNESLINYKDASDLLASISKLVLEKQKTFEEALEDIKNELGSLRHRQSQFVSLEFYLKKVFQRVSERVNRLNNYAVLIQKIKDYNNGEATVVTFNYDTLFEENLGYASFVSMTDYITGSIKLIKLHGSYDWVYIAHKESLSDSQPNESDYEYYKNRPNFLSEIRQSNAEPYTERYLNTISSKYAGNMRFPALAVPLQSKQQFICPKQHINHLEKALQEADRVLTIGWKGGEKNFLELMKKNIKPPVRISIVSSSKESADKIAKTYLKDFNCFVSESAGFEKFIHGNGIKEFLLRERV